MQVLSKIMSESLTGTEHQLTDHRNIFLASSALSLITWTSSLVLYNRLSNEDKKTAQIDEVSSAYFHSKSKTSKTSTSLSHLLSQLSKILKQILTRKDFLYAAGIAGSLILRTMCDLWMIKNLTQVEAAIIGGDFKKLKLNILEFLYASPILTVLNNGLKYCINRLQTDLRFKLSSRLTELYTQNLRYYHLNTMNIVPNIDQLLTSDIERFSTTLVDVYSNLAKPLFDVIVYIQRLSVTYTGLKTPASMIGYLMIAGSVLTGIRRPIAKMVMQESQLEGELRFVHSRLINNCEEIAFHNSHQREEVTLRTSLERLKRHINKMLIFKFNIDCFDNMITKYLAQVCGYMALSIPFMGDRYATDHHNTRLETYYKSGRIMLNMSTSIGRLVTAGRDINKLSAYTQRVNDLFDQITCDNPLENRLKPVTTKDGRVLEPFSGVVTHCQNTQLYIELKNIPLVTPNGELLVESINFRIQYGEHILIIGPNGSGKSSLFRTLAELWPLFGGELIKPANCQIFYLPQRPYLALGTLRDQIIYPQTLQQMQQDGRRDSELMAILETVELDYLLERETFSSVQDWTEILSGGEKQRLSLARLIYHRPQFAVLDECTSALSADFEQTIYEYFIREKFCSLISVSHRVKQLKKFHDYQLEFDGLGGAKFDKITEE